MKKHILISIGRGLVARNYLRCGVLSYLSSKPGVQVTIGVHKFDQAFFDEFTSPQVKVEVLPEIKASVWERLIQPLYRNLVFTSNEELNIRWGPSLNQKKRISWWMEKRIEFSKWMSRRSCFKRVLRSVVRRFPANQALYGWMKERKFDVVFIPDIQGATDIAIQRVAVKMNIPLVAMTKGMENASRRFFWLEPDLLLVQNGMIRQDAIQHQEIRPGKILSVGFPQFDIYSKPDARIVSREEHLASLGFKPEQRVIMFGSEGRWSEGDVNIAERLVAMNAEGRFGEPCGIIIRPHFTDIKSGRFDRFKGVENVYVDYKMRLSGFFPDTWDPTEEDWIWFVRHIYHIDLMITYISTLAIDAIMRDRPVINIGYGTNIATDGTDLTEIMYQIHHFKPILDLGGTKLVKSEEELARSVKEYLDNPGKDGEGRAAVRERYGSRCDGLAAQRIAETLLSF